VDVVSGERKEFTLNTAKYSTSNSHWNWLLLIIILNLICY
jgi:hypothetical protein